MLNLFIKNEIIEHSMEYKYLGIIFKPSGSFTSAIDLLCKKAMKAVFCIRKLMLTDSLHVSPHIKLFESCVQPIFFYIVVKFGR